MKGILGTKSFFKVFLMGMGVLLISFSGAVKASPGLCDSQMCYWSYDASVEPDAQSSTHGTIAPSGSGQVTSFASQPTFTATANAGYSVSGWTIVKDDNGINKVTIPNNCGTSTTCSVPSPENYMLYEVTVSFTAGSTPAPDVLVTMDRQTPVDVIYPGGDDVPVPAITYEFTVKKDVLFDDVYLGEGIHPDSYFVKTTDTCQGYKPAGSRCETTWTPRVSGIPTEGRELRPTVVLDGGAITLRASEDQATKFIGNPVIGARFFNTLIYCIGSTGTSACPFLPTGTNPDTQQPYQLGLIAIQDLEVVPWSNNYTNISTSDTDGQSNTVAIVANQGSTGLQYAARECSEFTGTNSWYLPAITQLQTVYNVKDTLNAAGANLNTNRSASPTYSLYWSSTQCTGSKADCAADSIFFSDGARYEADKKGTLGVRCVRAM